MINIFNIILLFLILNFQTNPFYNNKGIPSSLGIHNYVKNNEKNIIEEYEYKINDTIYDIYIFTDKLENNILGQFYYPDYIYITNEERYIAYELKELNNNYKQHTAFISSRTIKSVIFHELTHAYIFQIITLMQEKNMYVSPEYRMVRYFSTPNDKFKVNFIEEGICEYVVSTLNEKIELTTIFIPTNEKQLLDENNRENNLYCYSVIWLKDFMNKHGLKRGIEILVSNKPPTIEEILKSELFFKKLEKN